MLFWTVLFLILGFVLLIKSADYLVDGAAGLAKKFNIPKMVIGLTLVAFATSAPEATVSIIAAFQHSADISVGNVIGSNIANLGLILGLSAYLSAIPVKRSMITRGIPLTLLSTVVMIILGLDAYFQYQNNGFNGFALGDGLIFLLFFIVYIYYIFADLKVAEILEEKIEKKEKQYYKDTLWYLSLLCVGGVAGVLVGGKLVVDNAIDLAAAMGVSQALIGLTIVAIGTSLPELVTTIVAAKKHENDLALGNLIGSCVFNIFLVLGLASVISPIRFDPHLLVDALFMFVITVFVFGFAIKERQIIKLHGLLLMIMYGVYLLSLGYREVALAFLPF